MQAGDDVMTKEKFDNLSYEEMAAYAQKDPEGFAQMQKHLTQRHFKNTETEYLI